MDAGKRQISFYFNGQDYLEIPFFQRSYVWKEDLLKRFLESMEQITRTSKDYFMGSIISKQKPQNSSSKANTQLIVDGQQRLTTLALFLKVLLYREHNERAFDRMFFSADDEDVLCLCHNYYDRECFNAIMKQKVLEKVESKSLLANAYNYFLDHVSTDFYSSRTIRDKLTFVGISLNEDEDEQVIFDTINSLGVSLTTGELLKNFVFSKDSVDQYLSKWKPVFEDDEDVINYWNSRTSQGRLSRSNFDNFLYAYIHIKINDPIFNISSNDKQRFRSAENLFGQYKDFLNLTNQSMMSFVQDLTSYAKLYRQFISPSVLDEEVSKEYGIERVNVIIFGLDSTTLIPYVLFVLKNQTDEAERKEIFRILESYIMRRLICKSTNDNYSDLFSLHLINSQILTGKDLLEYLSNIEYSLSLAIPNNAELLSGFQNNILINQRAKGVLYLIEAQLNNDSNATSVRGLNSYSLEHLMPKKWKPNLWPLIRDYSEEDRNYRLKTLGNLAILPTKLNTSISNKAWAEKKKGSAKKGGLDEFAKGLVTLTDALKCQEWNELKIISRANWLCDMAKQIWYFGEDNSDDVVPIVPNLSAQDDSGTTTIAKTISSTIKTKDNSRFSLNGSDFVHKGVFAYLVVKTFVEQHPDYTYDQLKAVFIDDIIRPAWVCKGLIAKVDDLCDGSLSDKELERRYHFNSTDRCLKSADGVEFFVSTQWMLKSIEKLIVVAKKYGMHCEKQIR